MVAAGTVFRVLLLWRLDTGEILQRYRGHTGVIFDTLLLKSKDENQVRIGSVSDDRTVRVWEGGE